MNADADRMIRALDLVPHPEGGFFRETFRAPARPDGPPEGSGRVASTAIYFLLPSGVFSAFHRVLRADEIWHHYAGEVVEIHMIRDDGAHTMTLLGDHIADGELPQVIVPAGTLQAARARGSSFALCGCTVAPGFGFEDFVMPPRAELVLRFPEHARVIEELTRSMA